MTATQTATKTSADLLAAAEGFAPEIAARAASLVGATLGVFCRRILQRALPRQGSTGFASPPIMVGLKATRANS